MLFDDVNCPHNNYLNILQCSFDTRIDSGSGCKNKNSYDATVYCCEFDSKIHLIVTITFYRYH